MEEKIDLQLLFKRFVGNNMKLVFGEKESKSGEKVLALYNVVAFIENEVEELDCYLLQTREGGSTYGLDMSIRLEKPEYADFVETFLFVNQQGSNIAFRALSENVEWCDFDIFSSYKLNF